MKRLWLKKLNYDNAIQMIINLCDTPSVRGVKGALLGKAQLCPQRGLINKEVKLKKRMNYLIVLSHPDDEVLGAGASI